MIRKVEQNLEEMEDNTKNLKDVNLLITHDSSVSSPSI